MRDEVRGDGRHFWKPGRSMALGEGPPLRLQPLSELDGQAVQRNKDSTLSPLPSPVSWPGEPGEVTQPVETHLPGRWKGPKMAETGSGDADSE